MAVNYVKGQILSSILERDGIDIAIANANVGINTTTPTVALDVYGNINANNLSTTGNVNGGNLNISANVAAGNILTDNLLYANGTPWDLQEPAGANTEIQFNNNSQFGATANFTFDTAGNLLTVNATANIANINVAGNVVGQGNITGGNLLFGSGIVSGTGNVYGGNIISSNAIIGNIQVSGDVTVNSLTSNTYLSAGGNVIAGNVTTGGIISATGNITGGNLVIINNIGANTANITGNVTVGNISTVGNMAAGNVLTDHLLYANGTPWDLQEPAGSNTEIQFNNNGQFGATANFSFDTAANLLTVNATSNIANINVAGVAVVQGNVTGGNLLTNGLISAAGNITSGNLTIANTTIVATSANSTVTLQPTGTGLVTINTTTGLVIPVGNTAQRPSPGTTGTIRFNTESSRVEVYDGAEWDTIVAGVTNQTLNGDGTTTTFTLDRSTTTAAALIMLNGITQVPGQSYAMTPSPSTNLVFSEAPSTGDVIDIRFL